jgi:hypothetical protein
MNGPNHGFLGWYNGSNTFTATSTTQTLRFLAVGTPGVPPWLLLDNVQLTKNEVPGPLPFVGLGVQQPGAVNCGAASRILAAA